MNNAYKFYRESTGENEIKTNMFQDFKDAFFEKKMRRQPRTEHAFEKDSILENLSDGVINKVALENKGVPKRGGSIFHKPPVASDGDFENALSKESKDSGKTVSLAFYQNNGRDNDLGVLAITEKAIAFLPCSSQGNEAAFGYALGLAGFALASLTQKASSQRKQNLTIRLLEKYPVSFVTKLILGSQFIPFAKINNAIFNRKKNIFYFHFGDIYQKTVRFVPEDCKNIDSILSKYSTSSS